MSINEYLLTLWLFLPAAFANMAPVLFRWLPILNRPVDFGKALWGQRIFGDHKTWRGLAVGVAAAMIIAELQRLVSFSQFPINNVAIWGLLMGVGALGGDLVKSFIKRRLNIASGQSFPIADQIDWIVGALVVTSFTYQWPWPVWLVAIIIFGLLHPLVNLVGYWLGIKNNKW